MSMDELKNIIISHMKGLVEWEYTVVEDDDLKDEYKSKNCFKLQKIERES